MRQISTLGFALLSTIISTSLSAPAVVAEPRVDLEVLLGRGSPPTAAHDWMAVLNDVGFDSLRFRSPQAGERVELQSEGNGGSASYRVTGMLSSRNQLVLPGATFGRRDVAGIEEWLERLRDGGEQGLTDREGAFGLVGRDLLAIHEHLEIPWGRSSRDRSTGAVVGRMIESLPVDVEVSAAVHRVLAGEETVGDELQGVSTGTALAAALRPLGLVVVPQKRRGEELKLIITDTGSATESWPVGWPSESPTRDIAPVLFEFLETEIVDTPLIEALEAIAGRLEMPVLLDHNSIARHRIEPSEARVSFPAGRTYYKRLLDNILRQSELKAEIRVDEAEAPFLWITTIRP